MKRLGRIVGIIVVVLLVALVVGGGVVYAMNQQRLNKVYEIDVFDFEVPEATDDILAEGERIYTTRGCGDCHGADGGGDYLIQDGALGTITSVNITSAEYDYTADDYIRAIMHGVGHDGTPVGLMPAQDWEQMRAEELGPLLAYLLQLNPVENELDPTSYGPVGHALIAFNQLPIAAEIIDHDNVGIVDLEAEANIEYGEYMTFPCQGCHTEDYGGGPLPGADYNSANITFDETGLAGWSLDDFSTVMREGVLPDGTEIDPSRMPWTSFAGLTDTEIEAMYLYLQTVPPVERDHSE